MTTKDDYNVLYQEFNQAREHQQRARQFLLQLVGHLANKVRSTLRCQVGNVVFLRDEGRGRLNPVELRDVMLYQPGDAVSGILGLNFGDRPGEPHFIAVAVAARLDGNQVKVKIGSAEERPAALENDFDYGEIVGDVVSATRQAIAKEFG